MNREHIVSSISHFEGGSQGFVLMEWHLWLMSVPSSFPMQLPDVLLGHCPHPTLKSRNWTGLVHLPHSPSHSSTRYGHMTQMCPMRASHPLEHRDWLRDEQLLTLVQWGSTLRLLLNPWPRKLFCLLEFLGGKEQTCSCLWPISPHCSYLGLESTHCL